MSGFVNLLNNPPGLPPVPCHCFGSDRKDTKHQRCSRRRCECFYDPSAHQAAMEAAVDPELARAEMHAAFRERERVGEIVLAERARLWRRQQANERKRAWQQRLADPSARELEPGKPGYHWMRHWLSVNAGIFDLGGDDLPETPVTGVTPVTDGGRDGQATEVRV